MRGGGGGGEEGACCDVFCGCSVWWCVGAEDYSHLAVGRCLRVQYLLMLHFPISVMAMFCLLVQQSQARAEAGREGWGGGGGGRGEGEEGGGGGLGYCGTSDSINSGKELSSGCC